MMLGYLLARAGIAVTVLEKHADFLRDFRGDTVHPSTLSVLQQCGLLERFNAIPQFRIRQAAVNIAGEKIPVADFSRLRPFGYMALVPQWDFLNLLAEAAAELPAFQLLREHEVTELIREGEQVVGVRAATGGGTLDLRAELVVACDGRDSVVRGALGLELRDLGAPMDALWFRLPRQASDPGELEAILGAGQMMVMINRDRYWQLAYVVPKGGISELREQPISEFRRRIASLAPHLGPRCDAISSWDEVKSLVVGVNHLRRWHAPGVLLIGDAAHTMSPIGGVGVNLAIQDAVAAARLLAEALHADRPLDARLLARLQRRREWPTRMMQGLQGLAQKRVVSSALERSDRPPRIPALVRWLLGFGWIRAIPARIIGHGFRREQVDTRLFRR